MFLCNCTFFLKGNDFVRWKSDLSSLSDNTACLICWWKLPPGWSLVVCGEPKIKSVVFSHVASVTAPGSPALMGCRDFSCQWPIPRKSNSHGHSNVYLSTCQKLSGDASRSIWTLNANTAVGCTAPLPDWHGWMPQTRTWDLQTPYFGTECLHRGASQPHLISLKWD